MIMESKIFDLLKEQVVDPDDVFWADGGKFAVCSVSDGKSSFWRPMPVNGETVAFLLNFVNRRDPEYHNRC